MVSKKNQPPVSRPKPPYMTKDQMHHVIAVLWHTVADVLVMLEEDSLARPNAERFEKIQALRKIVFKQNQNQNQNEKES